MECTNYNKLAQSASESSYYRPGTRVLVEDTMVPSLTGKLVVRKVEQFVLGHSLADVTVNRIGAAHG